MSINFDKIKKGALKKQLKVPENYRFTTATLTKLKGIPTGARFSFRGNDFTMSPLLKKRITFAITLMGFSRKGNKRPAVKPRRKMRG
tara:strand:+ start:3348 stop:3608 length:261 start_codon:yes stop_codon:yes gene_type:complete